MNIEQRINKLEREGRNWRRTALGLALLIGVSLSCSSQNEPPTVSGSAATVLANTSGSVDVMENVRTRSLEVVNDRGEVVASLNATTWLTLESEDSNSKVSLVAGQKPGCRIHGDKGFLGISDWTMQMFPPGADIAAISIESENGKGAISVRDLASEASDKVAVLRGSVLGFNHDGKENGGLLLGTDDQGSGILTGLNSAPGSKSKFLLLADDNGGEVITYSRDGHELVTLTGTANPGELYLFENGERAVAAGASEGGGGGLAIFNRPGKEGKPAVVVRSGEGGGGAIDIYNPLNKPVVSLQSNKSNEGMVTVHDFNGSIKNGLTTDPR